MRRMFGRSLAMVCGNQVRKEKRGKRKEMNYEIRVHEHSEYVFRKREWKKENRGRRRSGEWHLVVAEKAKSNHGDHGDTEKIVL
jgi:1-aminocyclopropane-1-carboxylate deaminase/D-cysteine desulfhydrase-like pyridoxal-dependent ACC family enzyme